MRLSLPDSVQASISRLRYLAYQLINATNVLSLLYDRFAPDPDRGSGPKKLLVTVVDDVTESLMRQPQLPRCAGNTAVCLIECGLDQLALTIMYLEFK